MTKLCSCAVTAVAALVLTIPSGGNADPADPPAPRCDLGSCLDPLFTVQYPHRGSFVTSRGVRIPLPVHYYDVDAAFLAGTADLEAERELLYGSGYRPVVTSEGRGVAALLILHYHDSDIGPYDEAAIAFVVRVGDDIVVSNTPGAMLASVLDPANEVWLERLILDEQLPIDGGREYLFLNKEPDPKRMTITISGSRVGFDFAEPEGASIMSGHISIDSHEAAGVLAEVVAAESTLAFGLATAMHEGNLALRGVFDDVLHPGGLGRAMAVGHVADPTQIGLGLVPAGSVTVNPATPFGGLAAWLGLEPEAAFVFTGGRIVLDATL